MTEEKLDQRSGIAAKGRIIGLFLAALGILVLALWLLRQPIAEMVARNVCSAQKLDCKVSITRLDLGGITLTGVDARAPGASAAAISAREIVIDFTWTSLFSVRPVAVTGDELTVRLDLTGKRSLLGDLETAIATFTKPTNDPPQPLPKLSFTRVTLIGDTLSGPVQAAGTITAAADDSFIVDVTATPASLGLAGGTLDLNAASLRATVAGQEISAALKLDLANFVAQGVRVADVKVDATLQQSAGVLKGAGTATLGEVATEVASLSDTEAEASIESDAIGGEPFTLASWLSTVRHLKVDATTGEGAFSDITWTKSTLASLVSPNAGASDGAISLITEGLSTPQAAAGRVEVTGKVQVADNRLDVSEGAALITAASLKSQQRASVADLAATPLESVLPSFSDALRRAIERAATSFDVSAPWSANATSKGLLVSLLPGASLKSASGLTLTAASGDAHTVIGTFNSTDGAWSAAGVLAMQGGGGPPLSITIAKSEGNLERIAASGSASLKSWRVGADVVSAELSGLDVSADASAGAAAGRLAVRLDGDLAGGQWKGARATAEIVSRWDPGDFTADAPKGAVIEWERATYGETNFGAAALRYTTIGRLAERTGNDLIGQGKLAAVTIPVSGEGYTATAALGATAIGWRTAGGFRANFDMDPTSVGLKLDVRAIPIRFEDIKGQLDLTRGWKVDGGFTGGTVKAEEAHVSDLVGKFDLAGQGDNLNGSLTGVSMHIADPLGEERRFEEANFRGEGFMKNSALSFTGVFTMAKSGVQVAQVKGQHDLDTGIGALAYEPTPLIFRPKQFQPSDLSPLLIGPANVTGRLDIGGDASWSPDGFNASGVLDLRKLGFAIASAGVFEGVSGRVEVANLLEMRSLPGQRISIDKVTFGLPIEKGTIDFQLMGFDSILLESARWPFAGGFIRVDATNFQFSSTATNRIIARADNWDLAVLADQLKLPDMKLSGVVGGTFPVVFSTGSAEIDNAVLKSVKPGVIQYTGEAGDAAGQSSEYSKMAFDALKDFHYEVLEVGLDGNLTGQMMLTLGVLGSNPDVLDGAPFRLNIGIDSALVPLLTTTFQQPDISTAIEQAQDQKEREGQQ
jgi:translocation and assembly module TamB